jgi:hypothetical protein
LIEKRCNPQAVKCDKFGTHFYHFNHKLSTRYRIGERGLVKTETRRSTHKSVYFRKELRMSLGKEVVLSVPGEDSGAALYDYPMILQPGATPETIFDSLNASYATSFNPSEFHLVTRNPEQGRVTFGSGENVSAQVEDGERLWVVPSGELSLG